jgi:hypothetical protein
LPEARAETVSGFRNMDDITIEQAIYGSRGAGGYRFLARSSGFVDEWLPEAQRLCAGFGERPAGVECPGCVFAQPFGKEHVAVVQVADQGTDDAGRPGALGFRLLVMPRPFYQHWLGDPFAVAERFPPPWHVRGDLPALTWPAEPLPPRTVAEVQKVLQQVEGTPKSSTPLSPILLGATQALVDGSRLVFERPAPHPDLVRGLWTLLPHSTRCHLWPATFAFGNALAFDALVVPRADGEEYTGYLTEQQAGDYPEGRYELNLQIAAEDGDQRELDALFARRNRAQTVRLVLMLLGATLVLLVAMKLLMPPEQAPPPKKPELAAPAAKGDAAQPMLKLPPPEEYPVLTNPERASLTRALHGLAKQIGVADLGEPATAETLLSAIDTKLGTPNPRRDPGPLRDFGPPRRQLQALLWKHRVAGYDDPRLNPAELVERLSRQMAPRDHP